jgi:uncharacterized protein (PEP-CTERM system associated)
MRAIGGGLLPLLFPAFAGASELQLDSHLRIAEIYADSEGPVLRGREQRGFITEISPGFTAAAHTAKADARFHYILQNFTFQRTPENNRTDHLFAADAKTRIIPDFFFFDARVARTREMVSALAPQYIDAPISAEDRAVVRSYSFSPYIRRGRDSAVAYEFRYLRDHLDSSSRQLPWSDADTITASVKSGTGARLFGWTLSYFNERVAYKPSQDTRRESESAQVRLYLDPSLAILGTFGYEDNRVPFAGRRPAGTFWNAGFKWEPSRLTRLTLAGGERFFGKTWLLDFSHHGKLFHWTASHDRYLSSSRAQLLVPTGFTTFSYLESMASATLPDPVARARAVNDFIASRGLPAQVFSAVNFFVAEPFLEERFDSALTFKSARTTAILTVFRVNRDTRALGSTSRGIIGSDDPTLSPNVLQKGGSVLLSWQYTPRTDFELDAGFDDSRFQDTGASAKSGFAQVGVRHALYRKIACSLDYRYLWGRSLGVDRYRERAIIAAVTIRF